MKTPWRTLFAHLATHSGLKAFAQRHRLGLALARQYTGGRTVGEAVDLAVRLRDRDGLSASLFHLGEYVADPAAVEQTVLVKQAAAAALGHAGLDVHVSVDPTQIGLLQGQGTFLANLERIARAVSPASSGRPRRHALMLDMEDASVTDATLDGHARLVASQLPAAVTLQAYRYRSPMDLEALLAKGAMVRLVKGGFPAGPTLAHQNRRDIEQAYLGLAATMLLPEARARGVYPVFATHDHRLQDQICELARRRGWSPREWEFEMLLGARDALARRRAGEGHRVRLYIPFGQDWWPYAMRRIGENPRSLGLLLRGTVRHG